MYPPAIMIRMVLTRRRIRRGRLGGGICLGAFVIFGGMKDGEDVLIESGDPVTEAYLVVCFFHGLCPNSIDLHDEGGVGVGDHRICLAQLILILCNILLFFCFQINEFCLTCGLATTLISDSETPHLGLSTYNCHKLSYNVG